MFNVFNSHGQHGLGPTRFLNIINQEQKRDKVLILSHNQAPGLLYA